LSVRILLPLKFGVDSKRHSQGDEVGTFAATFETDFPFSLVSAVAKVHRDQPKIVLALC
jgi:hypothetical protein